MNIPGLIQSFSTASSYSVTRNARGPTDRGRIGDHVSSTFTIVASVSPASGRDIERLPEGRQDSESRTVITTTELYVGAAGSMFEADEITIDGAIWEVAHVEKWVDSKSGGVGWKAVAIRE